MGNDKEWRLGREEEKKKRKKGLSNSKVYVFGVTVYYSKLHNGIHGKTFYDIPPPSPQTSTGIVHELILEPLVLSLLQYLKLMDRLKE